MWWEFRIRRWIYQWKKNGNGKEFNNNNKLSFEGLYLNGSRSGFGKEYYLNGNLALEDEYSYGKKEGEGKEY